jgi:hypothetical protein
MLHLVCMYVFNFEYLGAELDRVTRQYNLYNKINTSYCILENYVYTFVHLSYPLLAG